MKREGTRAESRFRLSTTRTSPFKSAVASVQSTTGSRGVRISGTDGSNAGYTMFRGSVKSTGYPLHSPVSPSLPLPFVTVCHQVSNALYAHFARDVFFFQLSYYTGHRNSHFKDGPTFTLQKNSVKNKKLRTINSCLI